MIFIIKKYNLILKFSAIVSVDLIRVQSYYVLKKQLDMLIMLIHSCVPIVIHGFLVSKETVMLRRWGRSKQISLVLSNELINVELPP